MTHCKTCKPHPCNLITRKIFSINFKSFQAYDCIICIIILWHIYNVINPVSDSITKCIFSIITYIIFMNYFFWNIRWQKPLNWIIIGIFKEPFNSFSFPTFNRLAQQTSNTTSKPCTPNSVFYCRLIYSKVPSKFRISQFLYFFYFIWFLIWELSFNWFFFNSIQYFPGFSFFFFKWHITWCLNNFFYLFSI